MGKHDGDTLPPFARRRSLVRFPASVQDEESHRGRVAFIFCPANFTYDNRQPTQNESVRFEVANFRELNGASIGIGEDQVNGVKVVSIHGEFMGWVRNMDKHVLLKRLEAGNRVIGFVSEGYISSWERGGGDCVSGQVYFQDETMIGQRRMEERKAMEQEATEALNKDREFETKEFGYFLDDVTTDNSDDHTGSCFSPVPKQQKSTNSDGKLVFDRFHVLSSDTVSSDKVQTGTDNVIEASAMPSAGTSTTIQAAVTDTEPLGNDTKDKSMNHQQQHSTPRAILRGKQLPLTPNTPSNIRSTGENQGYVHGTPTRTGRDNQHIGPLTPVTNRIGGLLRLGAVGSSGIPASPLSATGNTHYEGEGHNDGNNGIRVDGNNGIMDASVDEHAAMKRKLFETGDGSTSTDNKRHMTRRRFFS